MPLRLPGHRPAFPILFCVIFLVVSMFAAPPAGPQQLDPGSVESLLENWKPSKNRAFLGNHDVGAKEQDQPLIVCESGR